MTTTPTYTELLDKLIGDKPTAVQSKYRRRLLEKFRSCPTKILVDKLMGILEEKR